MQAPSIFSITPSNQKGNVYGTEFSFSFNFPSLYSSYVWDFGDGSTAYNLASALHTYGYPDTYTVSVSAWTKEGFLTTDSGTVNANYALRDVVIMSTIPENYGTVGAKTSVPFVVSLTSCKINEPLALALQAFNTNSVPHYAVPDKWKYITPKWKFINAETNETINEGISIKTTPIYYNGNVVAVSGTASFYYVDDLPTTNKELNKYPLLLLATLSSQNFKLPTESSVYPYSSYSNSEVTRAVVSWQINDIVPNELKVTENYINDIYPVKWSTVPIPVMITTAFNSTRTGITTDVLSYPTSNEIGSANTVKVVLSSEKGLVPEQHYTVEVDDVSYTSSSAPLHFQARDEKNNVSSGYIFTTVTPLSSIINWLSGSTAVVAVSTFATNHVGTASTFPFPGEYSVYPYVYVSHPNKGVLNKINLTTYPASDCEPLTDIDNVICNPIIEPLLPTPVSNKPDCNIIEYFDRLGTLVKGSFYVVNTPILSTTNLTTRSLSGTSAVYGMAFNPNKNILYAADSDQDIIYVFNENAILLSAIPLSSYTDNDYNVPSYISVDGDNNIWVSLYGNQQLLKFDSNFNLILSAVPTTFLDLTAGSYGSPFIEAPIVETDMDNNIWSCYSHPASSMLVKFDGVSGIEMFRANQLSISSVPVSLAIDYFNNVWVACYNSNKLQCYSGMDGSLLYDINDFVHPSYIALDKSNNVWVTHGYNICSVYDTTTNQISSWTISDGTDTISSRSNVYDLTDLNLASTQNEIWGGLTVDVYNKVWVINSESNKAYVFEANSPLTTLAHVDVYPSVTANYVLYGGSTYATSVPTSNVRSAQAAGDWSGNRWYQKYAGRYDRMNIYGTSSPFKIYDINKSFQIAKVNEEFDTAKYYQDLALPEVLKNNTELFDGFLKAVVGDGNPTQESMGRIVYERIANFVQTHGDFETAEIDQLLSFANQLSVQARVYGENWPIEVSRLLNLFSVNKHYLRGQVDYDLDYENNIAGVLTESSLISADQYLYMRDRTYGTYHSVFVVPLQTGEAVYPLSSIELDGVRNPVMLNYEFFESNQDKLGYKNNIINWDSLYTNFNGLTGSEFYNLSSNKDWYGENGLVEIMFNNLLTKRLFSTF